MNVARPVIVTGADSNYFLMACGLMESAARFAPACDFLVLDFGLTEPERRHLQSRSALVDAPTSVQGDLGAIPPFYLKTMLGDYLRDLDPRSPIIWLDGDMVLGRDITGPLATVIAEMEQGEAAIAACEECRISDVLAFTQLNLEPFRALLSLNCIALDAPYFNSGFVIFRSRQVLADWAEVARRTPFHGLFDQNLLNLLLHSGYRLMALPEAAWNVHGRVLEEETLAGLLRGGDLPNILHATSYLPNHYETLQIAVAGDFNMVYPLKLFTNLTLRAHQLRFLYKVLHHDLAHHKVEIL